MSSRPRLAAPTLGKRIEEAYKNAGLNRTTFAKALGASYMSTYDWGRDKYAPRADYLQRIAEVTGYSVSELLGSTEVMKADADIPRALAAFLDSEWADDVTDEELDQLRAFQWPGVPSPKSYYFALLGIRAQLSPEDAREAVRISDEAERRAQALGIAKPAGPGKRRRN